MRNLKEFLGRQAAGTVVAGDRAGRAVEFTSGDIILRWKSSGAEA